LKAKKGEALPGFAFLVDTIIKTYAFTHSFISFATRDAPITEPFSAIIEPADELMGLLQDEAFRWGRRRKWMGML